MIVNLPLILVLSLSSTQAVDEQAVCTPAHLDHVEKLYERRKESNPALREAEQALGAVLKSCPAIPQRERLQEQLKIVQEESAFFHFQMAQIYLSGRLDGKGLAQGALSRLTRIYEGYPNFSKRDEAVYMLADLSVQLGDDEEAAKYFRSVVHEFPDSKYSKLAQEWLKQRPKP